MADKSIIVVGVDEFPASRRALEWAAAEAVRRGATLQVITAWTWDGALGAPLAVADPETMRAGAEEVQRVVVTDLLEHLGDPPVIAREVVEGTAVEALVEASRHADLVVVGTHGRGPVRTMLLGSVSQAVIRHAHCPVVVLPPERIELAPAQDLATASS